MASSLDEVRLKKASSGLTYCGFCGDKANLRCTGCYSIFYCNRHCQQKNFKQHKDICISLKPEVEKTKTANIILLEILDKVKLDKVEAENARKIVEELIEDVLIKDMRKNNKLFDLMYSGIFHSGSFYDGTKIEDPYEFDLNIVLDLNCLDIPFKIVRVEDCPPGYVMIQVDPSKSPFFEFHENELRDVFDSWSSIFFTKYCDDYFIVPENISKQWFGTMCSQAIRRQEQQFNQFGISKIRRKQCRVAMTMNIQMNSEIEIDVDIVPVFSFGPQLLEFYPEVWKNIQNPEWLKYQPDEFRNQVISAFETNFFAIPKPYQHHQGSMNSFFEDRSFGVLESSWRLDFREAETQIIKNKKCATNVIKLLKYFRNCNPPLHAYLKSYFLKMMVMLMIKEGGPSCRSWLDYDLCDNFLEALKCLFLICRRIGSKFMEFRLSSKVDIDGNLILNGINAWNTTGLSPTIIERQWIYEAGIGYFFDERFNLMADQDVSLIYSNMGGFGCACKACGCPIEKLWKNRDNEQYWMKHFQVPDLKPYLENEEIRKMCGVNLDIMKRSHFSDPNKALGKYNIYCCCKNCKKISKVISHNAWRVHFSKDSAEKKNS